MIIRSKRSRRPAGLPVDPLPGWESLREGLLSEVLTLVDQVDRLSPADDLAGVAARLATLEGRLARLRESRRG